MSTITLIHENFYIGSLASVKQTSDLHLKDIKRVLTVDAKPLPLAYRENFTYKHVQLLDLDHSDLLTELDGVLDFIDASRTAGEAIVVHCNAGQSRSGAVAVAYIMRTMQLDAELGLQFVKKMKSDVQPNEGFMAQLQLFGDMGWHLDNSNQNYKLYQLERISEVVSGGREGQEFSERLQSMMTSKGENSGAALYKCAKCRRLLFTENSLLTHTEGGGDTTFRQPWLRVTTSSDVICSNSIFIEPVQWMQDLNIQEQQGKLVCTKCTAKIGSWSWSGERCCCGAWITPAFHIDKKKVDKSITVTHIHGLQGKKSTASMPS